MLQVLYLEASFQHVAERRADFDRRAEDRGRAAVHVDAQPPAAAWARLVGVALDANGHIDGETAAAAPRPMVGPAIKVDIRPLREIAAENLDRVRIAVVHGRGRPSR